MLAPLLVLAALHPVAGPGGPPDLSADRVNAVVRPFVEAHPFAAVVVGVSTPDGHRFHAFGRVDPPGEPAAAPDGRTVFELGSVTKAFTGTLFARLIDEGVVAETDRAADRLPPDLAPPAFDGPEGEEPVTLRMLATHTSGLPVQPPGIGFFALFTDEPDDPYAAFARPYLARTLRTLPAAAPGAFAYSNLGVGLLGHALAHADAGDAGALPAVMRARLTGPLGLADTVFELTDGQRSRFPQTYDEGGEPVPPWTWVTLGACGGLRGTAADCLGFADACLGRGPAGWRGTWDDARRPRTPAGGPDEIGLCWLTRPRAAGGAIVWHNGGTGGSRSFLALLPDSGAAVVVLTNCAASVDALALELVDPDE